MMTQAREGGLSTADMVSATDRPDRHDDEMPDARRDDPVATPERMEGSPDRTEGQVAPPAAGAPAAMGTTGERPAALMPTDAATELRSRWSEVQTGFVDEPRHAVEQADSLVAEVMKRLAESFASERSNLEQQWDRGDEVSTEDLRVAMQRYRSFFDRLLSI